MNGRRRVGPFALLAVLTVVSCTDGGESTTTVPTSTTTTTPTPVAGDDGLPVLDDVLAPTWEPTTRTEELALAIDGSAPITVQQAVDVFDATFQPMPGATPSDLSAGDGFDATSALRFIKAVRAELTPEQRAIVESVTPEGTRPAGFRSLPEDDEVRVEPVGSPRWLSFATLLDATMADWRAYKPDLPWSDICLAIATSNFGGPKTLMWTEARERPLTTEECTRRTSGGGPEKPPQLGGRSSCTITVFPVLFNVPRTDARIKESFAHELFHCVQDQWVTDIHAATPQWLFDGSADWAAYDLYRQGYTPEQPHLLWWRHPETTLDARLYDAWPLFETFQQHGGDVHRAIKTMFVSGLGKAGGAAAFLEVGRMDTPGFLSNWSSKSLRKPLVEWEWTMDWPGTDVALGPAGKTVSEGTRGVGTYAVGPLDEPWSHPHLFVKAAAGVDIMTITPVGEAMRTHADVGTVEVADGSSVKLCLRPEGCECPAGQSSGALQKTERGVLFQFSAGPGRPFAKVVAEKWDPAKNCKKKRKCPLGCAMSNGDPHLMTVDGRSYDFMAAGEFVLLRNSDETLEVQARQEPYKDSTRVTINTAVAMLVDGHQVQIDFDDVDQTQRARLDGVEITEPTQVGAGRVLPSGDGFEVDFPDGTILWTEGLGEYGINIIVEPSAGVLTNSTGLLGTTLQEGARLPALADGMALPSPNGRHESYELLYGQFADSWRVADDASLFTYDDGASTDDFSMPGFPREEDLIPLDQLPPEDVAFAEEACAGVADVVLHQQCVFDVALTTAREFATVYEATEELVRSDSDSEAVDVVPTATTTPGDVDGDPVAVQLGVYRTVWGQALGADGTLYLSAETATEFELVAIDTVTGETSARQSLVGGGTVLLAADSVWVLGAAGLGQCDLGRFDAATLEPQATATTGFCGLGLGLASTGDAVWWVDTTDIDADGNGAVLRRIDPATNESGPGIDVPAQRVNVISGDGVLFLMTEDGVVHRLSEGDTELENLGAHPGRIFVAGTSIWEQPQSGAATRYDDGGAQETVDAGGPVVAADETAVYASTSSAGSETLSRVPADGTAPSVIASAPTVTTQNGPQRLSYTSADILVSGDVLLVRWLVPDADGSRPYIQTIPI